MGQVLVFAVVNEAALVKLLFSTLVGIFISGLVLFFLC